PSARYPLSLHDALPICLPPWRLKFPDYGLAGQRTLAPDTMLMSFAEMTAPFTRPGLSAILRSGANTVPSTTAAQQFTPPPPPERSESTRLNSSHQIISY